MRRFLRAQVDSLLYGAAFWAPTALLLFLVLLLLGRVEKVSPKNFLWFLPSETYGWGLVLLGILVAVYLSGVLMRLAAVRKQLARIPWIGPFLFGGEIMTADRLTNLRPCLFMASPTRLAYGWILSEEKVRVNGRETEFTVLNIYRPSVPLFIVGQLAPVRRSSAMRLGNSSREIVDVMLYTLRCPEALVFLPWPDETTEEFRNRAEKFGVMAGTPFETS